MPARKRLYLILALVTTLGVVAVYRLGRASDFDGFWRAGGWVLQGQDIYVPHTVQRYLPFFPVSMVPFAVLPMKLAGAIWHVISVLALWRCIHLCLRWLGRDSSPTRRDFIVIGALTALFWTAHLILGQVNLVVLMMILEGFNLMRNNRALWGGGLIGLSAAFKVVPAIFLVYLVLRRQWKAAAGFGLAIAATCLLTVAAFGPGKAMDYHHRWVRKAAPTAGTEFLRARRSQRYRNISLVAQVSRVTTPVNAGRRSRPFHVNLVDLPKDQVGGITKILQVPFLIAILVLCAARTSALPTIGFLLGATAFLSPIVWTANLVFLIPGVAAMWCSGDRVSRKLLVIYALAQLSIIHPLPRALGGLLLANFIITVGAGRLAWKERKPPAVKPTALPRKMDAPRLSAIVAAHGRVRDPFVARLMAARAGVDGNIRLIWEPAEGSPITEYCDRRCLTVEQRLEMFFKVCDAVHRAHLFGLSHGNLDPSSVLVRRIQGRPVVKVVGMGIAPSSGPDRDVTCLGEILHELLSGAATPGHLPPSRAFLRDSGDPALVARRRGVDPPTLLRILAGNLDAITLRARRGGYRSARDLSLDVTTYLLDGEIGGLRPGLLARVVEGVLSART